LKRPPADIAAGWRADSRPSDEQIAELLVKVEQKGTEKKGFPSDDEFEAILRENLKFEEKWGRARLFFLPKRFQIWGNEESVFRGHLPS